MDKIFSLDFLKYCIPIVGAALAWLLNEWLKRASDEYVRKEKKYEALVEGLQGFYTNTDEREAYQLKARFLQELNKCWLYCPDRVIKKAYDFLATVHTDKEHSDVEKEIAVGEFMVAIRKDLLSRFPCKTTRLSAKDFKHLRVNVKSPTFQNPLTNA